MNMRETALALLVFVQLSFAANFEAVHNHLLHQAQATMDDFAPHRIAPLFTVKPKNSLRSATAGSEGYFIMDMHEEHCEGTPFLQFGIRQAFCYKGKNGHLQYTCVNDNQRGSVNLTVSLYDTKDCSGQVVDSLTHEFGNDICYDNTTTFSCTDDETPWRGYPGTVLWQYQHKSCSMDEYYAYALFPDGCTSFNTNDGYDLTCTDQDSGTLVEIYENEPRCWNTTNSTPADFEAVVEFKSCSKKDNFFDYWMEDDDTKSDSASHSFSTTGSTGSNSESNSSASGTASTTSTGDSSDSEGNDDRYYEVKKFKTYTISCCSWNDSYCTDFTDQSFGDNDNVCFAASEMVTTAEGHKAISDVTVGDVVLTMTAQGIYKFAHVVYVPHAANTISSTFITLTTPTTSLKATPKHLIPAAPCSAESFPLMAMEDVPVGYCVMTVQNGKQPVLESSVCQGSGVYTIVTSESNGHIVVNDVVVSSFGINHAVANTYYNLHRMVYQVAPWLSNSSMMQQFNLMLGEIATH